MNDNLSFLLKEWTNRIKCAVESKYLVPLWWIVMQLSISICVVGSLICNQNDNYMSYWWSYFYSDICNSVALIACTACGRSYLCSYKVLSYDRCAYCCGCVMNMAYYSWHVCIDCRLWNGQRSWGQWVLCFPWRNDSIEVDCTRGRHMKHFPPSTYISGG